MIRIRLSDEFSKSAAGGPMKTCDFEKLVRYLDKQLSVDEKLDVLEHLDHCEICRDAVFHISRDRDANLFYYRPYNTEKVLAR